MCSRSCVCIQTIYIKRVDMFLKLYVPLLSKLWKQSILVQINFIRWLLRRQSVYRYLKFDHILSLFTFKTL